MLVRPARQHVSWIVRFDEFEILIHGVRRAAIPMRADLLLSGDQFHELAQLSAQIAPPSLDVLYEGLGLVLSQYGDLPNARIHAIR